MSGDSDYDPWAEAEAAVRGETTPKPKSEEPSETDPADAPEPAASGDDAPDPWAEAEAAVDGGPGDESAEAQATEADESAADPWAEAEAAVGGEAVEPQTAPESQTASESKPVESTAEADPWAEAESAVAGETPQAESADGTDPWAEAEAAVEGSDADGSDEAEVATTDAGGSDGDDPWAEAEAAALQTDAGEAAGEAAEPASDSLSWVEAVKAAAAAKQSTDDGSADDKASAEESVEEQAGQEEAEVAEETVAAVEESETMAEPEAAGDDPEPVVELTPTEESESVEVYDLVAFGEDEELDARVRSIAALLFASPDPLSDLRLVELLDDVSRAQVAEGVGQLQARLLAAGLPFECRAVAGGWRLFTEPVLGDVVARLARRRKAERLSQAGLETLAIVAYRQPVTKGEIEAIRGVQAGPMLRTLADRGLIRVAGRADQPGAPLLYATTKDFLDRFGLSSLKDLPRDAELARD